jgi:dolichol-phosphate mannosyltransferase
VGTTARRFYRFAVVGAGGVLVNSGVLWTLVSRAHVSTILAGALSTETAILSNFLLNDRWTFRDRRRYHRMLGRACRYNGVALSGLAVSVTSLSVLTYVWGVEYLTANLLAVGTATLWNYAVNARFTWRAVN